MPERPTVLIGIAVVEHAGRYLVGVRGDDGPLPGKAEFPGGKCRAGETPRDCAVRECREETGLQVEPIEKILNREFDYEHARVNLHFWLCRLVESETIAESHSGFQWVPAGDLRTLDFPEANTPLIDLLADGR